MAHGTRYELNHEPFVAFDLMIGNVREPYLIFNRRVSDFNFTVPSIISYGGPLPISIALNVSISGHNAIDEIEGVVYRIERMGKVDFLCKFVRHEKQDGKYFQENNNGYTYWNCDVDKWMQRYKETLV